MFLSPWIMPCPVLTSQLLVLFYVQSTCDSFTVFLSVASKVFYLRLFEADHTHSGLSIHGNAADAVVILNHKNHGWKRIGLLWPAWRPETVLSNRLLGKHYHYQVEHSEPYLDSQTEGAHHRDVARGTRKTYKMSSSILVRLPQCYHFSIKKKENWAKWEWCQRNVS